MDRFDKPCPGLDGIGARRSLLRRPLSRDYGLAFVWDLKMAGLTSIAASFTSAQLRQIEIVGCSKVLVAFFAIDMSTLA